MPRARLSWAILPLLGLTAAPVERNRTLAAPAIIILHGDLLAQRALMSNWHENHQLMGAIDISSRSDSSAVSNRPHIHLAMFWGAEWANYPRTPQAFERLRPEQANQHARFYPVQGDLPALVLIGPASGRRYTTLGLISEDGLAILRRYGVPVWLDDGRGPA